MAVEADLVGWLAKLRLVRSPVNVMARCASNPALIHHALHKIVALHAILMRGSIGKVQKICLPESDVFEFPVVLQFLPNVLTNRPVIGFALDQFGFWLSL